jgi:hypothetical protein
VSGSRYDVLAGALGPVGGKDSPTLPELDRQPAPWESSLQATCECLSRRGTLDTLERRQAEDALGETLYAEFPVHVRWALVTAHLLLDKGLITSGDLQAKMDEVRARFERDSVTEEI